MALPERVRISNRCLERTADGLPPQSVKHLVERALGPGGPGIGADTSVRIIGAAFPEGIRRTAIEEAADLVVMVPGHSRGSFLRAWSLLYSIIRESLCSVLSVRFTPSVGV